VKLHVRALRRGDEYALRKVFYSSVHELACKDYTAEQLAAWAPEAYEVGPWAERIRSTPPFIVDASGVVAGFAVLLEDGTIDQFFVASAMAGQGVARMLITHIHQQAARRGIAELHADVSLTAEPFFLLSGFEVEGRQQVVIGDVHLSNAKMNKRLLVSAS
jgi:putative acetyltransferase